MVEAAGVEPASGGVTGKATPCSASSEFSSPHLEKRQNGGKTTPNWFRYFVRGTEAATPAFGVGVRGAAGALLMKPSLRVNYAARARLLLLAAIVFHLFYEVGETSACNLSRARPRRSRFAPTGSLCHSKIRRDVNTLSWQVFLSARFEQQAVSSQLSACSYQSNRCTGLCLRAVS